MGEDWKLTFALQLDGGRALPLLTMISARLIAPFGGRMSEIRALTPRPVASVFLGCATPLTSSEWTVAGLDGSLLEAISSEFMQQRRTVVPWRCKCLCRSYDQPHLLRESLIGAAQATTLMNL